MLSRLQLGLDNLATSVIIANEKREIVYFNKSAAKLLNDAKDEIRKDFPDFSIDVLYGKKIEYFHRNPTHQVNHIDSLMGESIVVVKFGDLFMKIRATAIFDETGTRIGFMAEMRNVTETETKKAELLAANEKNILLNNEVNQMQRVESISRLTAGISHDFNNILGIIIGYNQLSKLIINECLHEQIKEEILFNLDQVGIASERGVRLINKMMTYSRQNLANKEIDVKMTHEIIEEVLSLMRPALTSAFTITATVDTSLDIHIDATELYQILTNLIVNARDAMKTGGKIHITLKEIMIQGAICSACAQTLHESFIELSVVDNGTGIDSSVIEHIFNPFFTTKDIGSGTGLGLSTVSGMVHGVEGHIMVESNITAPNTGTVFKLLFPMVKI